MRAVIFEVFTVNWPSAKLSSLQNLACFSWRARYTWNGYQCLTLVRDDCMLHLYQLQPLRQSWKWSPALPHHWGCGPWLRLWTMVEAVDHGWGCGPWLKLWTMVAANHYTFQSILYDPSSGLWHFLEVILMNVYFLCTFLNVYFVIKCKPWQLIKYIHKLCIRLFAIES